MGVAAQHIEGKTIYSELKITSNIAKFTSEFKILIFSESSLQNKLYEVNTIIIVTIFKNLVYCKPVYLFMYHLTCI